MAVAGASFAMRAGTVHAVVGENGAGKSTLASILAGFVRPDAGRIVWRGTALPLGDPQGCAGRGIAMVHQHFKLVPAFTVEENLALARLRHGGALARVRERSALALGLAEELGWSVAPDARVEDLPVGVRQRLELLKALAETSEVLVLDEPTATLSESEVQELFRVVRALRERGTLVVLIAHKIREVLEIADVATVLRRGEVVGTLSGGELDPHALAELMVGEMPAWTPAKGGEVHEGLVVEGLRVNREDGSLALDGVSLRVGRGEIVAVGGVDGNGQVELAESVAGVRPTQVGHVRWPGGFPRVGYLPQDRQHDGLALSMSVEENLQVGERGLGWGPFLNRRRVRAWAGALVERFDVRTRSLRTPARLLSGGNQQKLVVARALDGEPDLVVAVNPTRGLDVRAARFVHDRLIEARVRGAAVLLISSDLDELGALADRVAFLSSGRLTEGWGAASVVGGGA